MSRDKIGIIVGSCLSVALCGYLLYQLEWSKFLDELSRLRLVYLPLLIFLYLLSFWIRAIRWRLLLPTGLNIPLSKLNNASILGALATSVLPLRAGEFVRPLIICRSQEVKFPTAFASIVTERVFDVLAMLTLLGVFLSQLKEVPTFVSLGAQGLGFFATLIMLIMIAAYFRPNLVLRCSQVFFSFLFAKTKPTFASKLQEMATDFVHGLRAISSGRELSLIIIWSYVLWLEFTLVYQVGLWSMDNFPSLWVGIGVNVLIAIAIAVPSAPGFVGTFQFGCVAALHEIYGYSMEFALAYSIVLHVFQILITVIAGFIVLRYEGLRFRDIRQRAVN